MRRREFDRNWTRHDEATSDLLSLVEVDAPVAVLNGWTDEECRDAEWWAARRHLGASDNPVRQYPEPEHVKRLPRLGGAMAGRQETKHG